MLVLQQFRPFLSLLRLGLHLISSEENPLISYISDNSYTEQRNARKCRELRTCSYSNRTCSCVADLAIACDAPLRQPEDRVGRTILPAQPAYPSFHFARASRLHFFPGDYYLDGHRD